MAASRDFPAEVWLGVCEHVLSNISNIPIPIYQGELTFEKYELPHHLRVCSINASKSVTRAMLSTFYRNPLKFHVDLSGCEQPPDHDRPLREQDGPLVEPERSAPAHRKERFWYVETTLGFFVTLICRLSGLLQVPDDIDLNHVPTWPFGVNVDELLEIVKRYEAWLCDDKLPFCTLSMINELTSAGSLVGEARHLLQQGMFQIAATERIVVDLTVPPVSEVNRHYFIPLIRDLRYVADNKLAEVNINVKLRHDPQRSAWDKEWQYLLWDDFFIRAEGPGLMFIEWVKDE